VPYLCPYIVIYDHQPRFYSPEQVPYLSNAFLKSELALLSLLDEPAYIRAQNGQVAVGNRAFARLVGRRGERVLQGCPEEELLGTAAAGLFRSSIEATVYGSSHLCPYIVLNDH